MTTERKSIVQHIRRMVLRDPHGLTDGQLLDAFLLQNDEAAFEALVRRHGPMVLAICRRVLRNQHDAEDAFQASFLVLIRRAASIAKPELLGNWLYGVAYRTAIKSRIASSRRRAKEKQLAGLPRREPPAEGILEDLLALLDQELHRMPEKYRAPVVLCDLQGLSRKEAARKLDWPIGTLSWRLATARKMLAQRLTRQGLALGEGALAIALSSDAGSAAVPPSLVASTVKAGMLAATGAALPAGIVSAAVVSLTEGVVQAMFWSKLKIGMVVLLGIGLVGTGTASLSQGTRAAGQRALHPERGTDHPTAERSFEVGTSTSQDTPNFRVEAPTVQLARRIALAAERYRKEKALEWLGQVIPPWSQPCPIQVQLAAGGSNSATSFEFADGKVTRQHMSLQGPLDRILKADLPHEITHVILAHHFGSPLPRWADEGAAILSADEVERDRKCERIAAPFESTRTLHSLAPAICLSGLSQRRDRSVCGGVFGYSFPGGVQGAKDVSGIRCRWHVGRVGHRPQAALRLRQRRYGGISVAATSKTASGDSG
jgi:RNA polymerase sigma factor (sigma-70 family)